MNGRVSAGVPTRRLAVRVAVAAVAGVSLAAGVPAPVSAVEPSARLVGPGYRLLSDWDREVVWADFHRYGLAARDFACGMPPGWQRRWAANDARERGVPARHVRRYVKAYRVYVWRSC